MNVAIPILDIENNSNTIASSLNVNGFLCLCNIDNGAQVLMRTMDLAQDMGKLLPALEQKLVKTIITERIHPMALKVLVNNGFKVFRSKGVCLDENLLLFSQDELTPFDMSGAMDFTDACGGACSTCVTECADDRKNEG